MQGEMILYWLGAIGGIGAAIAFGYIIFKLITRRD